MKKTLIIVGIVILILVVIPLSIVKGNYNNFVGLLILRDIKYRNHFRAFYVYLSIRFFDGYQSDKPAAVTW